MLSSPAVFAARGYSKNSDSSNYSSSSPAMQNMLIDLSGHYVRDARAEGLSDLATRLSIGGMFSNYIGLDFQGLYQFKSSNYLMGVDLRIEPVYWLFFKGGVGGYASHDTRQFQIVPLAGMGIMAPLTDMLYFLSEASFFQTRVASNVTFGAGFGMRF